MLRWPRLLVLATLAGVLAPTGNAHAFCRTKACDTDPSYGDVWDEGPEPSQCVKNAQGCYLQGTPLFWSTRCLNFGVQNDGSAASGIDAEAARTVIQGAFDTWAAADCGGGTPSFRVVDKGSISCDRAEYNQDAPNQNVFVFRDASWPYHNAADALALTTLTFNVETGEIYDADVELNSHDGTFTITDEPGAIAADLASVVTHEVGHFLGLSHSSENTAVMRGIGYRPGTIELRVLTDDDIGGVCQTFPPGESVKGSCEPRHGFSRECGSGVEKTEGCAVARPGGRGFSGLALAVLCGSLLVFRRRLAQGR